MEIIGQVKRLNDGKLVMYGGETIAVWQTNMDDLNVQPVKGRFVYVADDEQDQIIHLLDDVI